MGAQEVEVRCGLSPRGWLVISLWISGFLLCSGRDKNKAFCEIPTPPPPPPWLAGLTSMF